MVVLSFRDWESFEAQLRAALHGREPAAVVVAGKHEPMEPTDRLLRARVAVGRKRVPLHSLFSSRDVLFVSMDESFTPLGFFERLYRHVAGEMESFSVERGEKLAKWFSDEPIGATRQKALLAKYLSQYLRQFGGLDVGGVRRREFLRWFEPGGDRTFYGFLNEQAREDGVGEKDIGLMGGLYAGLLKQFELGEHRRVHSPSGVLLREPLRDFVVTNALAERYPRSAVLRLHGVPDAHGALKVYYSPGPFDKLMRRLRVRISRERLPVSVERVGSPFHVNNLLVEVPYGRVPELGSPVSREALVGALLYYGVSADGVVGGPLVPGASALPPLVRSQVAPEYLSVLPRSYVALRLPRDARLFHRFLSHVVAARRGK